MVMPFTAPSAWSPEKRIAICAAGGRNPVTPVPVIVITLTEFAETDIRIANRAEPASRVFVAELISSILGEDELEVAPADEPPEEPPPHAAATSRLRAMAAAVSRRMII